MKSLRFSVVLVLLASSVSFGDGADPERAVPAAKAPASLPPSGDVTGMHFEQVAAVPDVYAVTFASDGQRVLVSDSFLALILQHRGLPTEVKLKAVRSYPDMVAANFETIMNSTFPDQSQTPAEAFEAIECTSSNGSAVTVEQDPLAAPYVRVNVRDRTGRTETYSINRKFIDDLLRQEGMNGERLAETIMSFQFRLPEDARMRFTHLSRAQLDDVILHTPAFQRQEIIRMPRFYREEATNVLARLSNSPPVAAVATGSVPAVASAPAKAGVERRVSSARRDLPRSPAVLPPSAPSATSPAAPPRKQFNWLALSGWGVAAVAVYWMIRRRPR